MAYFALWDVAASLECWRHLEAEATWSKATYTYGMAASLLQLEGEERKTDATKLMERVTGLRQRIAGKSIPLEKFVARKARKFLDQGGRLVLPAMELGYFYNCFGRAPRAVVIDKMLPVIEETLAKLKLHETNPSGYEGGKGYWEDLCLARFLEGVATRFVAYPDPDAVLDPEEKLSISQTDAQVRSIAAFQEVFKHGTKIELDHFLVYFTHFEYGRLLACTGDKERARSHFEIVLSGKPLEVTSSARKGKYSMENQLHVRTNACLEALEHKRYL